MKGLGDNMPVWLKCKNCGAKYYTARSIKKVDSPVSCDKCGNSLMIEKKTAKKREDKSP
ncbi:MAG: hypothetical protein UMU04_03160 [Halanaerobiales bacterium]|nr:hypothetical protein [Halanaerobiales bacterium]